MSDTVITVKNLSKRYRIGLKEQSDTFAEQLKNLLAYPIKNLKRLRSLSRFKQEEDESIFWALQEINFEVKKGEVLGIIGKNGAGKSTLLKILSRITYPTTGEIRIKGRVASLLEVGTGFHEELTGRENIYLNGTILGMTKKEVDRKFNEIVQFSGINKHLDTPVKFYSSGMKVRLGFSVAAHLEPEILIIDEVLAVGDAEFQKKCLGKMNEVAHTGRTILFVSHNLTSVQNICNKTLLLNNGTIENIGDTKEIIRHYLKSKNTDKLYSQKTIEIDYQNYDIKILKAFIKKEDESILMSTEILLNFNISLGKAIENFGTTFHLLNEYDNIVFGSGSGVFKNTFKKGDYSFTCTIPANLLNSGNYRIKLLIVHNAKVIHQEDEILTFSVNDNLSRAGWFGKLAGIVRPKLEWNIAKQ